MLAPLAHAASASAAISCGVTGSDGLSALVALGPVRAAVTTAGLVRVLVIVAVISAYRFCVAQRYARKKFAPLRYMIA